MENTPLDVLQNSSPAVSENVQTQVQTPAVEVSTGTTVTQVPGSQTPETNLLAALHEERARRKELEQQLQATQTSTVLSESDDVYSDEGKILDKKISELNATIQKLEDEKNLEKVVTQFPDLRGFQGEFDTFRQDFPRHKLENVAKLFLAEKGLLGIEPRKGLEPKTGGDKTPQKSGLSLEEVTNLRTNDFRKYQQMLQEGKITVN